ncbi:6,7-dimethyl-8-ribityllumazine synthase [Legionella taurinensis]|uniref:6,7-dimethyl-8-ribityllumazine synthase n=1 Tax=Legionella taurinensis TaxID=70611 RepID=A0A3A5L5U2_9GAMM|nr:6,7-dimethyl-8-ribityllumazine synthase [Legionella taurinensis]MDX1836985.1 6,7-dimethyl-8-ribityllumazine synthase [Legionella taurinensis]PUT41393.1 6,7-dimethyl-8-ribityllumazine synthase [Legionella taurinensis]PUT42632.1 6,7-dimethyl-8-ribityllumazine synthase [Legionella taurinensis]PUT46660.1 6,7-dimethyl-8-ribityllumazine synthase [Legionella taurinensis]PUT47309.1 6,7-dimethyl-8-ribityllumazine synthase [Legionella taurinensis]
MKLIDETTAERSPSFPVALVVSQFNRDVTAELKKGAMERLLQAGFHDHDLLIVEVPGAVEIPLAAQRLAAKGQVQAIIALGAVIRGETTHYDYVCEQVSNGCQRVALDYNLPVVFGVLTTENDAQAWDRLGGRHGHKGQDAADCAIAMHTILKQL